MSTSEPHFNDLHGLAALPLFAGLPVERLVALLESLEVRAFEAGDTLIEGGEPGSEAYVLLSGRAVVRDDATGQPDIHRDQLWSGALFGEMAVLGPEGTRRNATVTATAGGQLLVLPRSVVAEALQHNLTLQAQLVAERDVQRTKSAITRSPLVHLVRSAGGDFSTVTRHFGPGENLIVEGAQGDGLYILMSGTAGIYKTLDGVELRVAMLMRGGCAGERALLDDAPRTASVRAETKVSALFIDKKAFLDAYADNEEARRYFATLHRYYELPDKGSMSQHIALFEGAACIETTYELPRGRMIVCISAPQREFHTICEVGERLQPARECRWSGDDGQSVQLQLDERNVPIFVRIEGECPGFEVLYDCLFEQQSLPSDTLDTFERTGNLELDRRSLARLGDRMLCHCMEIYESRVRQLIRTYRPTLEQVQSMLGCGTVCGACREDVEELIAEERLSR